MVAAPQVKVIYLVRRPPGATRAEFIQRWRRHGALAMSMPRWVNVARYAHCDITGELNAAGELIASSYDGFGMTTFHSAQHRQRHLADLDAQTAMVADELLTFAEPIASARAVCLETVEYPAPAEAPVKLVRLVNRATDVSAPTFAVEWAQYSARSPGGCAAATAQHVKNDILVAAAPETPLCCDRIDELGFESADSMSACARQQDLSMILGLSGQPIGEARLFVTRENVLSGPSTLEAPR